MAGSRIAPPDEAAAGERDGLLATKVNIPQRRQDHLTRPRLIERLDQGMAREVILVCTPAGFGKTTLLADWAATARWPVAWLSLDAGDDDPIRFWRYVVVALDRAVGGMGERVLPLLSRSGGISGQGVVTALVIPPNAALSTADEPDGRAGGPSRQDSDGEEATMIPVLVAFGSFLTTLAGDSAALRFHDQRHLILGLAAGLMLGVVGFDLVPEALTQQPGELFGVPLAMLAAVLASWPCTSSSARW
jgi:hypothetical protein